MTNIYYILPLPNDHSSLWDIVVEKESTVRKNIAENKMVVKLYKGDDTNYPILNGRTKYTHSGILVEMDKPEWSETII